MYRETILYMYMCLHVYIGHNDIAGEIKLLSHWLFNKTRMATIGTNGSKPLRNYAATLWWASTFIEKEVLCKSYCMRISPIDPWSKTQSCPSSICLLQKTGFASLIKHSTEAYPVRELHFWTFKEIPIRLSHSFWFVTTFCYSAEVLESIMISQKCRKLQLSSYLILRLIYIYIYEYDTVGFVRYVLNYHIRPGNRAESNPAG